MGLHCISGLMVREISMNLLIHYPGNKMQVKLGFWAVSDCSIQIGGSGGMPPPRENFAKLKHFWCIFHAFQPIIWWLDLTWMIMRLFLSWKPKIAHQLWNHSYFEASFATRYVLAHANDSSCMAVYSRCFFWGIFHKNLFRQKNVLIIILKGVLV